jgi:hypothetical protein
MGLFVATQIMKPHESTGVRISEKHINSKQIIVSFIPFVGDG